MRERRSSRRAGIRETLGLLEQLPTVSPFLRMFYGLICQWIEETRDCAAEIETAFVLMLRIELRHHETVGKLVDDTGPDLGALVQASRRQRVMFGRLLRAIRSIPAGTPRCEMIRCLLQAECHYHLGQPERVVMHLRAAQALGGAHPLIHFALGYNLYTYAVQKYVRTGDAQNGFVVDDARGFRAILREAITAFREGLASTAFDGQIYWWIGQLSEVVRERADAAAAYLMAARLDREAFGEPAREKLQKLHEAVLDAATPEEGQRLAHLPAISEDDLREMRRAMTDHEAFPRDTV